MRRLAVALAALVLLRADMYPDASNAKLPEARQNILPAPTVGQCLVGNGTDWVQGDCGTSGMDADAGNATKPAAQHNLGQMKSIVPQNYGAVGNGVADDTVAVQAWLTALKTGLYYGQCDGIFRLTASVNAWPAKSYTIQGAGGFITGQPGGCQFLVDYNDWTSAAIELSNPAGPTGANRGFPAWIRDIAVVYNPALTAPPVGFRARYSSGLQLHNFIVMQYTQNWGQCLAISNAFNVRLRDVRNVGCGGNVSSRLTPVGVTFTLPAASTTLTSSAPFFTAADVGIDIALLSTAGPREIFRISAYTDPSTVTVSRASFQVHTAVNGAMGAITGAITAGSPTLTISHANLTANDIGRTVYVLGAGITAGTSVRAHRSTITAVSGATITLASNAASTAPAGSPVIISPAMEVYAEGADIGTQATNDIRIDGLHSEFFAGTGLVLSDGVNFRATTWKLHATNNTSNHGQTHKEAQFNAVLVNTDVQLGQAEIEGTAITTLGQIVVQGTQSGGVSLGDLGGTVFTGQSKVHVSKNLANAGVSVGRVINNVQIAPAWISSMVTTDGTGAGIVGLGAITSYATNVQLPQLIGTLPKATVATLPVCWAPYEGMVYAVSDANSAVFNAAVAAGGANKVIAYCDGAGWKVH